MSIDLCSITMPSVPRATLYRRVTSSAEPERRVSKRDLARREDPERRPPEPGAAARVELGPLAVSAEAVHHRLVEPDQEVERPDLAAVGVPGDLQVDARARPPARPAWAGARAEGPAASRSAPASAAARFAPCPATPDPVAVASSTPATTSRSPPRSTTRCRLCRALPADARPCSPPSPAPRRSTRGCRSRRRGPSLASHRRQRRRLRLAYVDGAVGDVAGVADDVGVERVHPRDHARPTTVPGRSGRSGCR